MGNFYNFLNSLLEKAVNETSNTKISPWNSRFSSTKKSLAQLYTSKNKKDQKVKAL